MSGVSEPRTAPVDPPGTILQHLYLTERISRISPGRFVDVGVGAGHISDVLLSLGWSGAGYDVSAEALERARRRTTRFLADGRFSLHNLNWLENDTAEPVDLVISSMVLEHLDERAIDRHFCRARASLGAEGRAIVIVPGSPQHWGVEDVIAGHLRRYTPVTLREMAQPRGWGVAHMAGLTCPLSNVLLGVSNVLVRRGEREQATLTLQQRTERSGDRSVPWKTSFPGWLRVVLNEQALAPFHWLQKRCGTARGRALVLYCELLPLAPETFGEGPQL